MTDKEVEMQDLKESLDKKLDRLCKIEQDLTYAIGDICPDLYALQEQNTKLKEALKAISLVDVNNPDDYINDGGVLSRVKGKAQAILKEIGEG
jgi:hypothetical protein